MWLIQAGGFPMIFILLFGLITLGAAIRFAWRPDERRVAAVKALSWAVLCAIGAGITSDLAAVGYNVTHRDFGPDAQTHMIVLEGFAESMAPGIVGFTLLMLAWMVMAVGYRRLGRLG